MITGRPDGRAARTNRTSPSYYCIVPRHERGELYRALCAHFSGDPRVAVLVERRSCARFDDGWRMPDDRRDASVPALPAEHAGRALVAPRGRGVRRRRQQTVADLVARAQGGDRAAFGELYRREFDRVRDYARRLMRDPERAEDLTQAVFLRAFAALPRYVPRPNVPFECWLFTIARNCAHTALDKERRQVLVEPDDLADSVVDERGPEQSASWISDDRLHAHYSSLLLAQRQVLTLRFGFDYDGRRTAALLGRSITDVHTIQHRALRQLGRALASEAA